MGSGSSKANSQKSPQKKPVANVNKDERKAPQEIKDPPPQENIRNDTVNNKQHERMQEQNNFERYENEKNKKEKSNKKKSKLNENKTTESERHDSGLVFEDDSDVDNNIDEVLRIPMAIEYPKFKKDKKEKDKRGRDNQQDNHYNNNYECNSSIDHDRREENLPETYAQRLQRKHYKLQQDMLLREKTVYRNPKEWDNKYSDDEEVSSIKFKSKNLTDPYYIIW